MTKSNNFNTPANYKQESEELLYQKLDICQMTEAQLNAELEKGYTNMLNENTIPVVQVFDDICRKL